MDSSVYSAYIVNKAIRNSLRGQTRKVLVTLGAKATSKETKEKLECIFGNVATGESVLQEFYNAVQKDNESITLWSKMLKNNFWRGLRSTELRNAPRVHFEKDKVGFEILRTKARAAEYELSQDKVVLSQDKNVSQKDTKGEVKSVKEEPVKIKDKHTSSKIDIQHQTVQQDSNTKLLIDIIKKMEGFEKRLDNLSRGMTNKSYYRGRGRGGRGQSSRTSQTYATQAPEKTEKDLLKE